MSDSSRTTPLISEQLAALAAAAKGRDVTLGELAGVGDESEDAYFLLMLMMSLPFCQPVPMLGLSTPFGIFLAAIGWAMAAGRPFKVPTRVASARVPHTFFPMLLRGAAKLIGWLERHLKRRSESLARSRAWRRAHGVLVVFWAVMLALPLPLPMSNVLSALPIAVLAAALLEDDGVMVVRAYAVSVVCGAYWVAMGFFGAEIIEWVSARFDF